MERPCGQTLQTLSRHGGTIWSVAFPPDSKYALTGSNDKTAKLWDAASGKELYTFSGHTDTVTGVAFSPDGTVVLTGSFDNTARLWEADYRDLIRYACARVFTDLSAVCHSSTSGCYNCADSEQLNSHAKPM